MGCIGNHPTAAYKVAALDEYRRRFNLRTLVETGLYEGYGSGMSVPVDRYIVIDWQQSNCDAARAAGHDARQGDSAIVLPQVLKELDGPALFWLDAHGLLSDGPDWPSCPLLAELSAIHAHNPGHVALIDDLCMLGDNPDWWSLIGSPSLEQLEAHVAAFEGRKWEERDCIGRLTPKPEKEN